jgi:hypothetical protein
MNPTREMRYDCKMSIVNLNKRVHLEDLRIDGKIMLTVKKQDVRMRTGFIRLRLETSGRRLL